MNFFDRHWRHCFLTAVNVAAALTAGTLVTHAATHDTYHPNDSQVFKAMACTKDHNPVEALYYIKASRSDMAAGELSPTSQLMKEEVDHNWGEIAVRLTKEEMVEERFADAYNALLDEMIPRLQQAVREKSGVSVFVAEVHSQLLDASHDRDVPACRID